MDEYCDPLPSPPNTYFDDDKVEALIAAVQLRPALWDPALKQYRKTRCKTIAWTEVMIEVNKHNGALDVGTVQLKWNRLRDQFTRHVRNLEKRQKSGRPATTGKKITWKWYKRMRFLLQEKKMEEDLVSQSSFNIDDGDGDDDNDDDSMNSNNNDTNDSYNNINNNNMGKIEQHFVSIDERRGSAASSNSSAANVPRIPSTPSSAKRIRHNKPNIDTMIRKFDNSIKSLTNAMSQQNSTARQMVQPADQFTIFGNTLGAFVANELRSLHAITPKAAIQLRSALMSACSTVFSDYIEKEDFAVQNITTIGDGEKCADNGLPVGRNRKHKSEPV